MKKFLGIVSVFLLGLILVACQPATDDKPQVTPDVTSIEFKMDSTTVTPGETTLVAVALPEGSDQTIRFTIQGIAEGVSITGNKLNVGLATQDGLEFTVIATSVYDPTVRQTIKFTVSNTISTEVIAISTEEELRSIATRENGLSLAYELKNDIVLTQPWTPIGVAEQELDSGEIVPGTYFNGIFDGKGFKISGIQISSEQPLFNAGFFAQIGGTGLVKNVEFEGTVAANGWSGGVAGINGGTIENVISNMEVTVFGTSAGSIVSVNRGMIRYSYGIGKVVSESNPNTAGRSAGLIVSNEGTMEEVYGDKDTLTSPNYTSFMAVLNPKYMLSTSDMKLAKTWAKFDSNVWHIENGTYPLLKHVGFVPPVIDKEVMVSITNEVSELDLVVSTDLTVNAEVINGNGQEVLVFSLKEEVKGVSIDQTGKVTFDLSKVASEFMVTVLVQISGTEIVAEKTFTVVYSPVLDGDVIEISTAEELMALLSGQKNPENLAKTYVLKNDIVLTEAWSAVGIAPNEDEGIAGVPFTGVFDGKGHTISGILLPNGGWNKGIFGYIGTTGVVRNVKFSGNLEANAWSGALAANNAGLIENVIVDMVVYAYAGNSGVILEHNHGIVRNIIITGRVAVDEGSTGLFSTNFGTVENIFANAATVGTVNLTAAGGGAVDTNGFIISEELFNLGSTYAALDSNIWNVTETGVPTLKVQQ